MASEMPSASTIQVRASEYLGTVTAHWSTTLRGWVPKALQRERSVQAAAWPAETCWMPEGERKEMPGQTIKPDMSSGHVDVCVMV